MLIADPVLFPLEKGLNRKPPSLASRFQSYTLQNSLSCPEGSSFPHGLIVLKKNLEAKGTSRLSPFKAGVGGGMEPGTALEGEPDDLSPSAGLATNELCKLDKWLNFSGPLCYCLEVDSIISTSKSNHENVKLYIVPAVLHLLRPRSLPHLFLPALCPGV